MGERKEIERERKRASRGLVIGCLLLLGSARFRLEREREFILGAPISKAAKVRFVE